MKKPASIFTPPSSSDPVQNRINELLAQDLVRLPTEVKSRQYFDEFADIESVDHDRLKQWCNAPRHTPFTGFTQQ